MCACTDQLEHMVCGYLTITAGDEVFTIIVCLLCLFVLQIATSILHLCPWIPSDVRRLLYRMGAHTPALTAGEELQLAKYRDFLHSSQKRDVIILIPHSAYFYFDVSSDFDFIFIW